MRRFWGMVRWCAAICAIIGSASCNRPVIQGQVVNAEGEKLPGVAVNSVGNDFSDLTNTLGEYQVRYRPGDVVLEFAKTGYTPARLELSVEKSARVHPPLVEMWRLPIFSGVYLLESFNYRESPGLELKTYYTENDDPILGTQREIVLTTDKKEPLIVSYGLPRYDARLHKLKQIQARVATGEDVLQPVWIAAESQPVDILPMDQPEGLLLQLRLEAPLEPGEYAVHWGAFEGYTTLDARIFPFRVVDPVSALVVVNFESEDRNSKTIDSAEGEATKAVQPRQGETADAPPAEAAQDANTAVPEEISAPATTIEAIEPTEP